MNFAEALYARLGADLIDAKNAQELAEHELELAETKAEQARTKCYMLDKEMGEALKALKKEQRVQALRDDLKEVKPWIVRNELGIITSLKTSETLCSNKVFETIKDLPDEIVTIIGKFFPMKEWAQDVRHMKIATLLLIRLDLPLETFIKTTITNPKLLRILKTNMTRDLFAEFFTTDQALKFSPRRNRPHTDYGDYENLFKSIRIIVLYDGVQLISQHLHGRFAEPGRSEPDNYSV